MLEGIAVDMMPRCDYSGLDLRQQGCKGCLKQRKISPLRLLEERMGLWQNYNELPSASSLLHLDIKKAESPGPGSLAELLVLFAS